MEKHIDYCWFNPVKHGLVVKVEDWPFSTFHRDHSEELKPGDFERKCAEYALANKDARFGERE